MEVTCKRYTTYILGFTGIPVGEEVTEVTVHEYERHPYCQRLMTSSGRRWQARQETLSLGSLTGVASTTLPD